MGLDKLYRVMAATVAAYHNCKNSEDKHMTEWRVKYRDRAIQLARLYMPSGAGFDDGTSIDVDASTGNKLVFYTSYHHHTDHGYDGWTTHRVTVRPSLWNDFAIAIGGRDRDRIKDYMYETFDAALRAEVDDGRIWSQD